MNWWLLVITGIREMRLTCMNAHLTTLAVTDRRWPERTLVADSLRTAGLSGRPPSAGEERVAAGLDVVEQRLNVLGRAFALVLVELQVPVAPGGRLLAGALVQRSRAIGDLVCSPAPSQCGRTFRPARRSRRLRSSRRRRPCRAPRAPKLTGSHPELRQPRRAHGPPARHSRLRQHQPAWLHSGPGCAPGANGRRHSPP